MQLLSYLQQLYSRIVPPCPGPAVDATLDQHQALLILAQRRSMLLPMLAVTIGTLLLGWVPLQPKTLFIIVATLCIGQLASLIGYRHAVFIAQNPRFDPKDVSRLLLAIVFGIRVSIALAFAAAAYYEQPTVAGACAVSLLLIVVFGSLSTDHMPWSATFITLLQAIITGVALYLRYLREGFPLFELSLQLFLILLVMSTILSIAITRATREAHLRIQLDQIKLSNNERITNAVFTAATEGFAVTDRQGHLLRANEQFKDLLELSSADTDHIKHLLPDEVRLGVVGETNLETESGRFLTIDQRSAELAGAGTVFVFVVRDNTNVRRVSIENLHNQKVNAIGMLAGGIAHDFNNLIAVIQGNAELIAATDSVEAAQKKSLDAIIASSQRASSLTTKLMSFTRQHDQNPTSQKASDLVNDAVDIIRPSLGRRIQLQLELTSQSRVKVEHTSFVTALLNLMFNARDAMQAGGVLLIAVTDTDYGSVRFRITDTGTGIPEEILHNVTKPFFTTKSRDQGTGLGLSMVQKFVDDSGGQLILQSAANSGTDAIIELPATSSCLDKPNISSDPCRPPQQALNILVIDDNCAFARMLQAQITLLGHTASTTSSLSSIKTLTNLEQYDLVICDYLLESETAITVYDWFRDNGHELPFVFISGNIPDDDVESLAQRQSIATLHKPLTIDQLRRTLDAATAHTV